MNTYSADFQKAVEGIALRASLSDRITKVVNSMDSSNSELEDIDEELSDTVHDLMEEYGEDNALPEGWWEYEATTEDIVRLADKLIRETNKR